ncbi:hypothetical protein L195_g055917, partial [Trifolium pratense]
VGLVCLTSHYKSPKQQFHGLNDAIDMVEKLGISSVIFETDLQILVNSVKKNRQVRKRWGLIVNRCFQFLLMNPSSQLVWIKRDKNRVAHQLALWAEMEPNMDWPNFYPNCISYHIQKDMGRL